MKHRHHNSGIRVSFSDLILLALKANQDKSSWWSVAFSCLSLLHVLVLGILFGVSFKALGSWIVIVWFKGAGFMSG